MKLTFKTRKNGGYWAWDADNADSPVITVVPQAGTRKVGQVSYWVAKTHLRSGGPVVIDDTRGGAARRLLEELTA